MTIPHELLRRLPAINKLLQDSRLAPIIDEYGRDNVVNTLRETLDLARERLLAGKEIDISPQGLITLACRRLEDQFVPTLRAVINATGVVIHTNLGRAILSGDAQQAIMETAANYSNLEFDLETGMRGSRYVHAEEMLKELTGAEAALVVNNNASALVLMLSALAREKSVIISRGQLVEIGGGFRIPTIMEQSGAKLIEVGTTNRTRIADYEEAVRDDTAMLMRIHASNFRIVGFVQSASVSELAQLAHKRNILCADDVGSGALLDTGEYGMLHEPMVQESIKAGADLVLFSGDKLLGGPQAGIMVGRKEIIQTLKRHPLARALRTDKLVYAALSATLNHYRRGDAVKKIPVWRMIAATYAELKSRAKLWSEQIGGDVIDGESAVGGGSTPGTMLPTALLALDVASADQFAAKLREADFPIIVRISEDRVVLDPRTVLPEQEDQMLTIIKGLLGQ